MSEFERLGESRLWRSSFRLGRLLRLIFGPSHREVRQAGQSLVSLAGQVVFAREDFDRRIYLEEFLNQAQAVEDLLYRISGHEALFRAWFRLGQAREEAFGELERSVEQMHRELQESVRVRRSA